MIATKQKAVRRASANGFHAASISLNASRPRIVEVTAVNCSPKICVKLEITTAPLLSHGGKNFFQMLPGLRMGSVKRVPWSATPAAKSDAVRTKRFFFHVLNEPIRMLG